LLIHNFPYRDETEFDSVDRDWAIRTILGVGPDSEYEVIAKEDWVERRLVADRFRDRRVFICGDAAHLWIPHGGYGMNAGWHHGCRESVLDDSRYVGRLGTICNSGCLRSRAAIGADEVSRSTMDFALKIIKQRREISAKIELPRPVGDAVRARLASHR
jgi:FAD binding domain